MKFLLPIILFLNISWASAQEPTDEDIRATLTEARKANDYSKLAKAYLASALYEENNNRNPEKSFEQLARSLEYYELIKDSTGIMACRFHIARQLLANDMLEEAFDRMKELRSFYVATDDQQNLMKIELLRYDYFFEKLEIDSCEQVLSKIEAYQKKKGDGNLQLEYHLREISYHELLQDYDEALGHANACVNSSENKNNPLSKAKCLTGRGRILMKVDKVQEALSDFKISLGYTSDIPYSKQRLMTYKYISECYRSIGFHNQAMMFMERYADLQDSILNENRLIAVNNLTYKYESKEKASEIKMLEMDKQFVQRSIQQQRRALTVLGIALAGLILGIYYLIRFYTDRIKSARIIDIQNHKINQQKIRELQDELQINSMHSMITGQELERERIAKDLHDSLGGLLSTIKLQIDNVKEADPEQRKKEDLEKATGLLDIAVSEVRTISQDLQPGALKRLGLVSAINDLLNRYRNSKGPYIDFQHFGIPAELEQNFAMSIYRIVQEILNNAIKHAKASEIFVQLNMDDKGLTIHIEDDGIGFDADKKYESMGLENIRSRVNYLKGTMEIDSRENQGTSFIIHVDPSKRPE